MVICFSASNLTHAAGQIKGRKFAFADHDKSATGERAAQQAGIAYCMSPSKARTPTTCTHALA